MPPIPIRVGIVGLGLVSTAHLKGYRTHPRAEVAAVCDLDRDRAVRFAAEHGIGAGQPSAGVYTDYATMLAEADLDMVDIATPTYLHAPMTQQAAEAGLHVHCEKPFCRTVGEGLRACEAARRHGVILGVGETYVFLTSHRKARELIEAGEIGRPRQVRQRHGAWLERSTPRIPTGPADRTWRIDGARSGGGDYPWIFDHAVHFYASAEYFMLDTPIASVHAVAARQAQASEAAAGHGAPNGGRGAAHDPYRAAEVDIPIITWTYEDAACQGVWMRAERLNGTYDHYCGFSTVIIGESGMIEVLGEGGHNLMWEGRQVHLVLHRQGKESVAFRFDEGGDDVWQSDIAYYSQGHVNQVHALVDAILAGEKAPYAGEDGVRAVRCTLATIRSAREDRVVRVDEVGEGWRAY